MRWGHSALRHPGRHLRHAARVDADAAEGVLDEPLGRRDAGPGLAREEEDPEAEAPRVDALAARRLREVERVGRRPVEGGGTDLARPLDRRQRLALDPGAEGEHRRAEALPAGEGAPGAHVEAEERADEDAVARPDADRPEDPRVRLADPRPVVARRCRTRWGGRSCRWCRGCGRPPPAGCRGSHRRAGARPGRRGAPPSSRPGSARGPRGSGASSGTRRRPPTSGGRRSSAPRRGAPAPGASRGPARPALAGGAHSTSGSQ